MTEIVPAILPKNYEDLKNKVAQVRGSVDMVQVDICDGVFVPSMTWPFISKEKDGGIKNAELDRHFVAILSESEGMPFWEDVDYELDLMVHDAIENFDIYTKLSPKRILFHIGAVGDLGDFRDFLEGIDPYIRDSIEFGLAILPSTDVSALDTVANLVDSIQVMGNDKIGYQGVSLDPKTYETIKEVRKKYFDMPISVDIGVNQDTAEKLIEAGATRLSIGSAIFSADDIIGRIEEFKNL